MPDYRVTFTRANANITVGKGKTKREIAQDAAELGGITKASTPEKALEKALGFWRESGFEVDEYYPFVVELDEDGEPIHDKE